MLYKGGRTRRFGLASPPEQPASLLEAVLDVLVDVVVNVDVVVYGVVRVLVDGPR